MGLPEVARTCLVANVASIMLVGPRIYKLTGMADAAPDAVARVLAPFTALLDDLRAPASLLSAAAKEALPADGLALFTEAPAKGMQGFLSRAMAGKIVEGIEAALPPDSLARVCWNSASGEHAGAGFASIPREDIRMLDGAFQNNGCLRTGIAMPHIAVRSNTPIVCGLCGTTLVGELGAHALTCAKSEKDRRHDAVAINGLTKGLKSAFSGTGVHVDGRHAGFVHHGLTPHNPLPLKHRDIAEHAADIAITEPGTRPVLVDPTVVTPTLSGGPGPARTPGHQAKAAEDAKIAYLHERFLVPDLAVAPIDFRPFGVETFGRMGDAAECFITDMARRAKPPMPLDSGGEWDVDGQMSICVRMLRARTMTALAAGNEIMFARFRMACRG